MVEIDKHSDEELLVLLKTGSEAAFEVIFRRYWGAMLDHAYQRLKSRPEAEEVVQDVFLSLYARRTSLPDVLSVEAYIKKALMYKVIDVYRSRQLYRQYVEEAVHSRQATGENPSHLLELKEARARVLLLADQLPQKCREVFVLSRIDGLSNKEIAASLAVSVATVKSHLNKALKLMRAEFGNTYF